ncbi:hypothetical protein [Xenorhabdus hominickii]|uniref:Uncharacterized protein n=1 Tax=Xenorhabdus hominickii TaxID=351679 RepID=A0A2G0QB97_XENHO|nr:hypothetical protein [Xenorhabdus hominickii]AOM40537.1 hypothetical protein A9255_08025 [Xenorhabdus hominickii]PHM56515.1 hypothetical protein Xhom_02008 [Xenorhabdus hominickii]
MTVSLVNIATDESVIELTNGNWFEIVDITGMENLIDTDHFNDSAEGNSETARKMADLIEAWTPSNKWGNGNPAFQEKLKKRIIDFFRNCEGFYTY